LIAVAGNRVTVLGAALAQRSIGIMAAPLHVEGWER
jgi:hypothetical protein